MGFFPKLPDQRLEREEQGRGEVTEPVGGMGFGRVGGTP